MYKLVKSDIFETSPFLNKSDMSFNKFIKINYDCIIEIFKYIIILLLLYWFYKQFIIDKEIEKFTNIEVNGNSMDRIITSNCRPDYCLKDVWGQKVNVPDTHKLSNLSTSQGCCIIPNELSDEMYKKHFHNKF